MSAPDRQRDGGPFTAGAICPHCATGDVHLLRASNPEPPRVIYEGTGDVDIVWNFGGRVVRTFVDEDEFDRWDERGFEVIRTCTRCGYEWGQR